MENNLILAIESSCDETSAAVIKNGRDVIIRKYALYFPITTSLPT